MVRSLAELMEMHDRRDGAVKELTPPSRMVVLESRGSSAAKPVHERLDSALQLVQRSIEYAQCPVTIELRTSAKGKRLVKFPFFGNERLNYSSLKGTAVFIALLQTVQTRLARGDSRSTIRDLYYSNVELYKDQRQVEYWLGVITQSFGLKSRQQLMVVPAQKGLVYTSLPMAVGKVVYATDTIELIPYMDEKCEVALVKAPGDIVVTVFEKEAVFNRVVQKHSTTKTGQHHIFVTGKGYPDSLTKKFLAMLVQWGQRTGSSITFELYVDADPDGVAIALNYINHCGAQHIRYKGITLPRLIAMRTQLLDLTQRELLLARNMLLKRPGPGIATQLQRQLFFHKKGEMNACYSQEW